jgi:hypothetical protein
MLTVACVLVTANVPYSPEYVIRLRRMVARHLPVEHRFLVLTDRDRDQFMPHDISVVSVPRPPLGVPGWWSKLHLFNPRHGLRGLVLYIDLDVLIVRGLEPLLEFRDYPLTLVPHAGSFRGRGHLRVIQKYNSSVMLFDPTRTVELWTSWKPTVAGRLWGDQDWIAEQTRDLNVTTWPLEWFPRISELQGREPGKDAMVVLCKKPKNHEAVATLPWAKKVWG